MAERAGAGVVLHRPEKPHVCNPWMVCHVLPGIVWQCDCGQMWELRVAFPEDDWFRVGRFRRWLLKRAGVLLRG